jgi:hypothetical protein
MILKMVRRFMTASRVVSLVIGPPAINGKEDG